MVRMARRRIQLKESSLEERYVSMMNRTRPRLEMKSRELTGDLFSYLRVCVFMST